MKRKDTANKLFQTNFFTPVRQHYQLWTDHKVTALNIHKGNINHINCMYTEIAITLVLTITSWWKIYYLIIGCLNTNDNILISNDNLMTKRNFQECWKNEVSKKWPFIEVGRQSLSDRVILSVSHLLVQK